MSSRQLNIWHQNAEQKLEPEIQILMGSEASVLNLLVWVNKTLTGANRKECVKDRLIKNDKILEAGKRRQYIEREIRENIMSVRQEVNIISMASGPVGKDWPKLIKHEIVWIARKSEFTREWNHGRLI